MSSRRAGGNRDRERVAFRPNHHGIHRGEGISRCNRRSVVLISRLSRQDALRTSATAAEASNGRESAHDTNRNVKQAGMIERAGDGFLRRVFLEQETCVSRMTN